MKDLLKNKLVWVGVLVVAIAGYFFIPAQYNQFTITSAIANQDYKYFCVVPSAKMINKKSPGFVSIRSVTLETGHLWGNKSGFDGVYAVIFTNDLITAQEIFTAREKFAKALSKKKIPYCQVVQ